MKTTPDDPRLSAYLFEELGPKEKALLEKELADNPELRSELEELRSLEKQLQTSLKKEAEVFGLSATQSAAVARAMSESKKRPGFRLPLLEAFFNRPGLSFACAVLLVGLCLYAVRDMVVISNSFLAAQRENVVTSSPDAVADMMVELPVETETALEQAGESMEQAQPVSDTVTGSGSSGSVPMVSDIPLAGKLFASKDGIRSDGASLLVPPSSPANKPSSSQAVARGGGSEITIVSGERSRVRVQGELLYPKQYVSSQVVDEGVYTATNNKGAVLSGYADAGYMYSFMPKNKAANEAYESVVDNPFKSVGEEPLSTFSIDVDTASYTNLRRFLNQGLLPPPNAVRIEEMLNYFSYDYPQPVGEAPFTVSMEVAACPWNPKHQLAHVGIQGRNVSSTKRAPLNLVFLIDVSGSMSDENKLPLVKKALQLLVKNLNPTDRVALVTYAGNSRLALPSTPATQKTKILQALENLESGGSTNGEGGILRAYDVAREHFIRKGINRVILATDGDFNVGVSNREELVTMIQKQAKSGVYLNIFGFGMGNLKDATLEQLANKGNGIYGYIDSYQEARKVFAEQVNSTLITIAKDVKIQIEFNPARVGAYRLIGYENRMLNKEDFNDDRKDAGEIGAGHSVTALYELIPPGVGLDDGKVDPLKYQMNPVEPSRLTAAARSREVMTLKLRYKEAGGGSSKLLKFEALDSGYDWMESSNNFRFAASVAAFGMVLRDSPHRGESDFPLIEKLAQAAMGKDPDGYRREYLRLVRSAAEMKRPVGSAGQR